MSSSTYTLPSTITPPFEESPVEIQLMQPLTGSESELYFNKCAYFVSTGGGKMHLDDFEVANVILTPDADRPATVGNLVMTFEVGDVVAGHLPNITDMFGRANIGELNTSLTDMIESCPGMPLCQTEFFNHIIDPAPVLDFTREIYGIGLRDIRVDVGSHTDGLQVFSIEKELSSIGVVMNRELEETNPPKRMHRVKLSPMICEGVPTLPSGGKIVIWNGRGFARPSLKENLIKLISAYKPVVVVVTEARVSKSIFRRVYDGVGLDMDWEVDECTSFCGGAVVLWDTLKVDVDLMKAPSDSVMRFLGDIKAPLSVDDDDDEDF